MKKLFFAALLIAGTTLGFAKEVKQENNISTIERSDNSSSINKVDNEKTVITKVIKQDSKGVFLTWIHVEFYYTTTDADGYVQIHYYSFDIPLP